MWYFFSTTFEKYKQNTVNDLQRQVCGDCFSECWFLEKMSENNYIYRKIEQKFRFNLFSPYKWSGKNSEFQDA